MATGKLTALRDPLTKTQMPASYNLATIMGGGEVMFELVPLLERKDFATAWLQYCRIGGAPAEVLTRDRTTGNEGDSGVLQRTKMKHAGGVRTEWCYQLKRNWYLRPNL